MDKVLPTVPISDLRKEQARVLALLKETPIVLTSHGDVAGVFVKVEEWNKTAEELRTLRRRLQAAKHFAEMEKGYFADHAEVMKALGEAA
jgi:PHD/YefM family antitoxin component YafN of YafNO toxin-antitoxin module